MTQKLNPEELDEKIKDLGARHRKVLTRKSELAGQLQAKKKELAELVLEIKEAGFNPKTLVEDRERLEEELTNLLVEFETQLSASEEALRQFDNI
jgi:uncharacterized protein YoxC